MLKRLNLLILSALTFATSVMGHGEENETVYGPGMMMYSDGTWMHNGAHMVGYNMWGLGWFGLIPGLLIWTLIILAIIYLYQKVTEKSE